MLYWGLFFPFLWVKNSPLLSKNLHFWNNIRMKNPPLNKPCPCDSGKKYKRCCLLTRPVPLSQEEKFMKALNESIEDDDDEYDVDDEAIDDYVDSLFCDDPFCLHCSQPVSISSSFGFMENEKGAHP